jgi:hypothetical protein
MFCNRPDLDPGEEHSAKDELLRDHNHSRSITLQAAVLQPSMSISVSLCLLKWLICQAQQRSYPVLTEKSLRALRT